MKKKICENQFCEKVLKLRKGQKMLNPKRRFCDKICQTRENTNKWNYIKKFDKKHREEKNRYFRKWYKKNKKKHQKKMLELYHKNKSVWNERGYAHYHKKSIWEIIGKVCVDCGREATEFNHIKYDFPSRKNFVKGDKRLKQYLVNYCKFLEPICMPCHRKRKVGRYILK